MISLLLALSLPASAARPTQGGQFGYTSEDEVVSWDSPGGIRVHYAISGPSTTLLDDEDEDGTPDFVQDVAHHVEGSFDAYAAAGFRRPLHETDVGLGLLGGSDAFDVYLVDFGGGSDGAYRNDRCQAGACAGHLLIENDFVGYGYSDLDEAVATLASHELFHAVQAAYVPSLDVWVSEGTATWAERLYDPDSRDYLRLAGRYLQDTNRSLDKPPAGPVPPFAYATALWFDFLTLRHDDTVIVDLLEALATDPEADPLLIIGDLLVDRDDSWRQAFTTFTTWNLATFTRAGGLSDGGYPYASKLPGATLESVDSEFVDEIRVFPVAAVFFAVDHDGGPLWGGSGTCDDDLPVLIVFPASDGPLPDPIDTIEGAGRLVAEGQDLPAGRYFAALTVPEPADSSQRDVVCLQAESALDPSCMCASDTTDDTDPPVADGPEGCGCSGLDGAPAAPLALLGGLLGVLGLRRRRGSVIEYWTVR